MKKYIVIRRILFIFLLLYIILLFGKNINFLKSTLLKYPYEKVEAEITDIFPMYNRSMNLKTEIVYSYGGRQETVQVYYTMGDAVGKKVSLLLSDNKIARNCFVFSWADLQCIVLMGVLIFLIHKKYMKLHYQAAIEYSKKLYQRQSDKEDIAGGTNGRNSR